ncbi:hypothetical protein Plhal710r2_c060g0170381 [Plasmopara halstedii]
MKVICDDYTLDIPSTLWLHPTFFLGRLKKYHLFDIPGADSFSSGAATIQRDRRSPLIDALSAQRWIPRSRLLEDVSDVVNEYEKTLTYKRMSGEGEPYLCVRGDAHLSETWSRRWYRATICE